MKILKNSMLFALLALLLLPAAVMSQDEPEQKNVMEFGIRAITGDVRGRQDLQFRPDIITSKFNEYSDRRNGFYLRRADLLFDDLFGTSNFIELKSTSSVYRNQSYLVTYGRYGKFSVQFRYDEIPHIYTNTARTIYSETSPGNWQVPVGLKQALQTASSTGTAAAIGLSLPSFIVNQITCGPPIPPSTTPPACAASFVTPRILRKMGTGSMKYNVSENWALLGMYSRENQVGHRPIALIFNSSPGTGASTQPGTTSGRQSPGTATEVPESIDYYTDNLRFLSEYGRGNWAIQFGYTGSFFDNNISTLFVDNPFATADVPVQIIAPGGGCTPTAPALNCAISAIPARAQMDLYPDNKAHYLNFAGAFGMGKYLHLLGTVNPGWLYQNDPFLPYTANSAITGLSPLPAPSLDGKKQTLAMNWTLVGQFLQNVQLAAKYRHYDYNNNTRELIFTPVQGDIIGVNSTATAQTLPGTHTIHAFGYNKKTVELTGNWFFAKRSSVKLGYEGEWFDREHRDVNHSREHSFIAALDVSPWQDFLFRAAYRHSDRDPKDYQDELSEFNGVLIPCSDTTTVGFTDVQRCSRRFDETKRILDRADLSLQYDFRNLSLSGGFQTIQNDMNHAGGVNSAVALNFLTGAAARTEPYYLYGLLKDISFVWTGEATYTFSPEFSVFAEYTRENYYRRMISRYRTPTSGTQTIITCNGCDTANNDWESTYSDIFDTYAAGVDFFLAKKVYLTTYYSLSDGKGRIPARFLGDPTILAPATTNRFLLVGTTAAVEYPQSNTRIHELSVVVKYKLNKNLTPKFEYRLEQFDNDDAQTSVMFPYMGCMSPATGTAVTGCPTRVVDSTTSPTPVLSPNGQSPFYPGFRAGDNGAARFLFLGADQPAYRVHVFTATLEYRW